MASAGRALIVVENESVPFDCRVWREAQVLRDAGWRVTVISAQVPGNDRLAHSNSSGGLYEALDGVEIYRFPITFAADGIIAYLREYLGAFAHVARMTWHVHRHGGFDVLQVCNPPDIFFPLGFFYRLLGKGFIFDHHDLAPEGVQFRFSGFSGQLVYRLALLAEKLTMRIASVVIATNQSYRRLAIERGGVAPERVFVVRNGPELAATEPAEPDLALRQGFAHLVCYLGVMGAEDGVEPMLEAIRFVVQGLGRRDVRFVLIGDGSARPLGLDLIERWNLGRFVEMPGRLPADRVRKYLSTADICLSPDPYTPLNNLSTMTKVMDYMSAGKPLVSFDLREIRYSAQDAAVYVPPGDVQAFGRAIVDLLDDPARRQQMGEVGRRRILAELAWEHQKPQLLAAYNAAQGHRLATEPGEDALTDAPTQKA